MLQCALSDDSHLPRASTSIGSSIPNVNVAAIQTLSREEDISIPEAKYSPAKREEGSLPSPDIQGYWVGRPVIVVESKSLDERRMCREI